MRFSPHLWKHNKAAINPQYLPEYLLPPKKSKEEHENALDVYEEEARAQTEVASTPPAQTSPTNPVSIPI